MPFPNVLFLHVMSLSNINLVVFNKMNTRRTIGHTKGGEATGDNKVPPEAPAEGVAMQVKPTELTDVEVRASPAWMEQAMNMQAQSITDQVIRHNVHRENPSVRNMAERLRDFMRKNPPTFKRSKTLEDPRSL